MMSYIPKFLASSYFRQLALIAGGTGLGQLLVAGSSPILTRLYSPEHLGMLALFISLLSPIQSLATLRLDVAALLPADKREANTLLVSAVLSVSVTSIICAVFVIVAGDWLAGLLNAPKLSLYLYFLPVSLIAGGFFQVMTYGAIRNKDFAAIGTAKLMQSIWMVACQLVLGVLIHSPLGLFIADPVGRSSGGIRLAKSIWQNTSSGLRARPTWVEIRNIVSRYRRFPQFSVGPAVLNSLALQLPNLLIASSHGAGPTGLFALTQRLLGMPLNLVSSAVAQVFLGNSAELARSSLPALERRTRVTLKWLLIIGLITVVPVALVAPLAFGLLFGEAWQPAGVFLQLLSPMFIAQFCASPLGGVLDLLERQDLHLYREMLRTVLLLFAAVLSAVFFDSAQGLVGCLSIASAIGYGAGVILVFWALSHAQLPNGPTVREPN